MLLHVLHPMLFKDEWSMCHYISTAVHCSGMYWLPWMLLTTMLSWARWAINTFQEFELAVVYCCLYCTDYRMTIAILFSLVWTTQHRQLVFAIVTPSTALFSSFCQGWSFRKWFNFHSMLLLLCCTLSTKRTISSTSHNAKHTAPRWCKYHTQSHTKQQ